MKDQYEFAVEGCKLCYSRQRPEVFRNAVMEFLEQESKGSYVETWKAREALRECCRCNSKDGLRVVKFFEEEEKFVKSLIGDSYMLERHLFPEIA